MTTRAIEAQLDDLEDEGTLMETAQTLISQKSKNAEVLDNAKKQNDQNKAFLAEFQNTVTQELNTQYTPQRRTVITKTMQNAQSLVEEIVQNPKAYIKFIDLLTYYNPETKNFDLSSLEKAGQSKALNVLKKKIEQSNTPNAGKVRSASNKPTNDDDNYEFIV